MQISNTAKIDATADQIFEVAALITYISTQPGRIPAVLLDCPRVFEYASSVPYGGGDLARRCVYPNVFHVRLPRSGHIFTFVSDDGLSLRYSNLAGVRFPDGTILNGDTCRNWYVGPVLAGTSGGVGADRNAFGFEGVVFPDSIRDRFAEAIAISTERYHATTGRAASGVAE